MYLWMHEINNEWNDERMNELMKENNKEKVRMNEGLIRWKNE